MTAERLLENMLAVYSKAPTYRDTGRIVTRLIYPNGARWPDRVQVFKTAFIRPARIRLESWHLHLDGRRFGHTLAWAEGSDIRTWSQRNTGFEQRDSLYWASMHTLGLDGRAAQSLLALLFPSGGESVMPDQKESWFTDLIDVVQIEDARIGETPCYRLQCRLAAR